jgi:hypothetical protein
MPAGANRCSCAYRATLRPLILSTINARSAPRPRAVEPLEMTLIRHRREFLIATLPVIARVVRQAGNVMEQIVHRDCASFHGHLEVREVLDNRFVDLQLSLFDQGEDRNAPLCASRRKRDRKASRL